MKPLGIEGAWLYTPRIHEDARGAFLEWFRADEVAGDVGHTFPIAQANCPVSRRGVIRGIHVADVPPGQAKYVTCVSGDVLDVAVDLRVGSPTFGRWEAVRLDDRHRRALYLAEGLGHALMALSEEATVMYLCSTPWDPQHERTVHPLDPDIGIAWPDGIEPVLSERDAAAPSLADALRSESLPHVDDCRRLAATRRPASARQEVAGG